MKIIVAIATYTHKTAHAALAMPIEKRRTNKFACGCFVNGYLSNGLLCKSCQFSQFPRVHSRCTRVSNRRQGRMSSHTELQLRMKNAKLPCIAKLTCHTIHICIFISMLHIPVVRAPAPPTEYNMQ